jgi:cation:H+ antiporter
MAAPEICPVPPPGGHPNPRAAMAMLGFVIALTLPAVAMRLAGFEPHAAPIPGLLGFGLGVVAAAFLLTWAAEVAQLDIGSGLAVVFIALVTVLPEYAVDMYLAWTAASVPENQALALANMTGANRLLIGVGWPTVSLIVWYRRSQKAIVLDRDRSGDVVWLLIATLYSAVLPLKGDIAWYDAVVLIGCYVVYVRGQANAPEECHDLVGPPQVMGVWSKSRRRRATLGLFLWSAAVILVAAEPFVESLKAAGTSIGIGEYFLIQWLAPLASESPEFVVVVLLTVRGRAAMALGAFISSKVNQWTLLVGGVPLAFGLAHVFSGGSFGSLADFAPSMAITDRQIEELWLTVAQGLYATATIMDLHFSLRQALAILGLFLVQFVGSVALEATGHHDLVTPFHYGLCVLYGLLTLERMWTQRRDLADRFRDVFAGGRRGATTAPAPPPDRGGRGSPDDQDA